MNKEKEIERMELLLVNDILLGHDAEQTAKHLVNNGIGDKKQAVKEFVKLVNDELENMAVEEISKYNYGYNDCIFDMRGLLDNLITELYGAEEWK